MFSGGKEVRRSILARMTRIRSRKAGVFEKEKDEVGEGWCIQERMRSGKAGVFGKG
jgi:hypothetical protein